MANNKSEPTGTSASSTGLFFIARYGGRPVAIRKNTDFSATLTSIQKAFPTLRSLDVSEIRLLSQISGCGDELIEITEELWADLSPEIKNVQIDVLSETEPQQETQKLTQSSSPLDKHTVHTGQKANCESVIVHVQDPEAHLKDLYLPLFATSTIRDLKELIVRHDNRLPQRLTLNFEGYSTLEDHKQLHEYGIKNGSTVNLVTAYQVYLTRSGTPGSAVTIPIFAAISAIKILAFDLFDLHPLQQTLSCDGAVLMDEARVGSYGQLVPGCIIFVNETPILSCAYLYTFIVCKENSTNGITIRHSCRALRASNVLDLRVLVFNKFNVPLSRQQFKGHKKLTEDYRTLTDCEIYAQPLDIILL